MTRKERSKKLEEMVKVWVYRGGQIIKCPLGAPADYRPNCMTESTRTTRLMLDINNYKLKLD